MLQDSGWLGRTFIAYGLGNFLWWERSYSIMPSRDLSTAAGPPLTRVLARAARGPWVALAVGDGLQDVAALR